METDREVLSKIVSERADKIQAEALKDIEFLRERSEKELDQIIPDLLKQVENFSVFKLLDVLDVIRNGGVVKTGECVSRHDHTQWNLTIGNEMLFHEDLRQHRLDEGRYRITLIMEKLAEEAEG